MNTLCFKSKLKDLQQIEAETIVSYYVGTIFLFFKNTCY